MPTKYKIFLRGASPYNPDPGERLAHKLSFPQFKMEWCPCISVHKGASAPIFDDSEPLREFKIGGNMECLVEMVQIENSFRNVDFTLWNRFSWAFLKTLKPMSFRGLRPLDPRCHNGILDRNSTIDNSVQNYMWILPLIFPFKTGFLCLLMC